MSGGTAVEAAGDGGPGAASPSVVCDSFLGTALTKDSSTPERRCFLRFGEVVPSIWKRREMHWQVFVAPPLSVVCCLLLLP